MSGVVCMLTSVFGRISPLFAENVWTKPLAFCVYDSDIYCTVYLLSRDRELNLVALEILKLLLIARPHSYIQPTLIHDIICFDLMCIPGA